MPPPAVQVTVCWASWDWISDSRYCICCPSCSRLDKSAIRRKLPLAQTGGKLLEQLQVQRVHGRVRPGATRTTRLPPPRPPPLLRETAGPRSGPLPPLPALPPLPLPAPRALEPDTHRLGDVATDQLGQRLALPLQSLGVDRVGRPRHDGRAVDCDGLDGREQRSQHRLLAPRVLDDTGPERAETVQRQGTLLGDGDGGRGTGAASRSTGAGVLVGLPVPRPTSPVPLPRALSTSPSSTVLAIIAHRNSSSSTTRRAFPLARSWGSSSVRTPSRRTTSGAGSGARYFSIRACIASVNPSGLPPRLAISTARSTSPAPVTNSPRSAPPSTSRPTSGNTPAESRSATTRNNSPYTSSGMRPSTSRTRSAVTGPVPNDTT